MDKFNNTIITNAGRKLLNNVSGGQGKITYTKAVLYNQDISSLSDEDLMALTSLSGDVVTTNISIVKVTDTTVTAEASFTNAKLTQDVTFNAIGWFASVVPGDDETLIAVTPSATTQTLVAGSNGKATASVDFKLLMGISHDAQVHLTTNEAGTIDQTHLDNALRDLAAKGLINQGEDIGNDVDISQIHNTSIQTANGTDLTNMPKDYSNHGYLISIGSNDTTKDGIHVLYDTQKNIQYVQYFNNKTNKWTDWLANSTEQDLKDLKKNLDNYYTKAEVDGKLTTVGAVKTVDKIQPDSSGNVQTDHYTKAEVDNKIAPLGKVKKVADISPNDDGNVPVPSYAPNLLLGTQGKPKTVDMGTWSANADVYSIDPSIDLSGQTVTVSIKLAKSANDTAVTLGYKDSTGAQNWPGGIIVPAGTTGYSTITKVLPANVKNISVRPAWVNGNLTGTCTYSEAKLAVWKSADLPPDMTWVPNEADKANSTDITNLQNTVNNIDSTHTPIVVGASGDDLFSFKTNQIRLYNIIGNTCKNLPPASNTQWFTVQYLFEAPGNNGIAIYRTPSNEIWTAGCNDATFSTGWVRVANATDITNLQNQIQAQQTAIDSLQQSSHKIVPITQADYDALSTKDPNTIYAIGG